MIREASTVETERRNKMNMNERVGIVLMVSGVMTVLGSTLAPTDPTPVQMSQILIGSIVLVAGAARFIWSERNDE